MGGDKYFEKTTDTLHLISMLGRSKTEASCVMAWHSQWTEHQRQRFRTTVAQLESGPNEEDLLFGMTGLGLLQGEGPDMFECQLKLFSGWWRKWPDEEKRNLLKTLQISL